MDSQDIKLTNNKGPELYKQLFYISVLVTAVATLSIIFFPDQANAVLDSLHAFVLGPLGWYYLLSVFVLAGILAYLALGKYGKVRLGGADAEKEFSDLSWYGMIVSCGTGSSLLYFGTIEWAFYYNTEVTPWSVPPGTWQAGEMAFSYSMFHEGISAWALYGICAIVIGYFYHNKKLPFLRLSSVCGPVLGEKIDGWVGKLIDVLFIFGVLGGVATSIGISTRQIGVMISDVMNIDHSFTMEMIVLLLRGGCIVIALMLGLDKGISKVADLNMVVLYGFLTFVLFVGPTSFIFNNFVSGIGSNISNFVEWSLWTDAVGKTNFPQDWTIFYWAWWAVYAPITGVFLAQISKGRTFREIALGVVVGGTTAIWLMYAIMSGYAMNLELTGAMDISGMMATIGGEATTTEIVRSLPGGNLIVFIYAFAMFIYSMGTLNSFSYTLAAATTKTLKSNEEPKRWNRVFWAGFLNVLAVALMYLGGMNQLKIAAVLTAFPLFIIIFIMVGSFFKSIKTDEIIERDGVLDIGSDFNFYVPKDNH